MLKGRGFRLVLRVLGFRDKVQGFASLVGSLCLRSRAVLKVWGFRVQACFEGLDGLVFCFQCCLRVSGVQGECICAGSNSARKATPWACGINPVNPQLSYSLNS